MAVAALNWKFIGSAVLGGGAGIEDVLDAIYTIYNSSTYYDGSSRTAGSGVAWNPTKFVDTVTKAVYLAPSSAASVTCKTYKIVFAGEDTGSNANFPLCDHSDFPPEVPGNFGQESWGQAHLFGGLQKMLEVLPVSRQAFQQHRSHQADSQDLLEYLITQRIQTVNYMPMNL